MSFCRGLLLELKGETCTFMENGILWQSLGIIICLVLSGFFSASETAFTSLNRIRMKNKAMNGDRRAERALKLADPV